MLLCLYFETGKGVCEVREAVLEPGTLMLIEGCSQMRGCIM